MTPTDYLTKQEANTLDAKREEALKYLGDRWVLHPRHSPTAHGSTQEATRPRWERPAGVWPRYGDLRAEAAMLRYYEKRNQEDLK